MNVFSLWNVGVSFIVLISIVGFTIWMVHPRVMPITVRGLRRQPLNLIGIIGFIFGFTAFVLIVCAPNKNNSDGNDVVTVFSALVTALIAWQIWVTITSREEIKEMRENTERVMTENNRLQHLIEQERHQCEGLRWHIEGKNFLADSAKDIKAPHMAYTHLARALEHYIYAFQSDLMYINDTLENMGASITNAQNEPLAAEQFRFHEDECNRLENVILDILHLLGNQSRRIRNEFEGIRQKRRQVTSNAQLHHP